MEKWLKPDPEVLLSPRSLWCCPVETRDGTSHMLAPLRGLNSWHQHPSATSSGLSKGWAGHCSWEPEMGL